MRKLFFAAILATLLVLVLSISVAADPIGSCCH
jgi:hypothetical protein